ncbi:ATPase family associated with various cellular activities (AAA) [Ruminococcus flavefaciens]|uniref:ATPase family associated with various cellular activities (AAA) n=2 Tax=Ruminococcus flavefaciens TaxID=1265 RepID=A0A1K1MGW3_RUMFL|nr:ATPase family associated with various cellular activities (AAA) [Ruminococcus flavefaciens]
MRYFEFSIKLKSIIDVCSKEGKKVCDDVSAKCIDYCNEQNGFSVYINSLNKDTCKFVLSGNGYDDEIISEGERFWKSLEIDGEMSEHNEISADKVKKIVYSRSRTEVYNHDDIGEYMQLESFSLSCCEERIVAPISIAELRGVAERRNISELIKEADRIEQCHTEKFIGHPVHYIIQDSNDQSFENVADVLIGCLFNSRRLESQRVMTINIVNRYHIGEVEYMYENMYGGTMIFSVGQIKNNSSFANSNDELTEFVFQNAIKYKNKVLTIFRIGRHDTTAANKVAAALNDKLSLITFEESLMSREKSREYVCKLADEREIPDKSELLNRLNSGSDKYYASDIDQIFNDYYSEYLRSKVYPAYFNISKTEKREPSVEGRASEDLNKMIGLEGVKKVIYKTVAFFKLLDMYKERGLYMNMPARSMIFTGNPGTAKTTVARLAAKIFKDNGLIENGKIVEVGRADLVAMYVGQTAPKVKEAFRRAKGSILFIDEAYSLVDDRDGLYGDEAINTIVQEMENRREETIVVFAGYPDKMEEFMKKNPGLRSRIAFHVDFPDYNEDELYKILCLMVEEKSMRLSEEAEEKVKNILAKAIKCEDFGNGRFVRNLVEQAIMSLAERLSLKSSNMISDYELTTLIADDFVMPELGELKNTNRIGF